MRRLDCALFRLAWHLTSVSDLAWSWANTQMLVSCAHDGSHRFWNLSLRPRFELCNADSAWAQRELVGCSMLAWPGCPHDSLAASSDGLVQVVRLSGTRIIQPFARLEAADSVGAVLQEAPLTKHRAPKHQLAQDVSAITAHVTIAASLVSPHPPPSCCSRRRADNGHIFNTSSRPVCSAISRPLAKHCCCYCHHWRRRRMIQRLRRLSGWC